MSVLELMDSYKEIYSSSEKKVYELIKQQPDIMNEATITYIAEEADTSVSAVLRFTKTLGFKGYKDFRYAFTHDYDSHNHDSIIGTYSHYLEELSTMNMNDIESIVDMIIQSRCVFITGVHYASLASYRLSYRLEDLDILCVVSDNNVHSAHMSHMIQNNDCVITFSSRGQYKHHKGFIESLGDFMPKNSILITSHPEPKIGQYYHKVITLPHLTPYYEHYSETVMMIYIDMIINRLKERI